MHYSPDIHNLWSLGRIQPMISSYAVQGVFFPHLIPLSFSCRHHNDGVNMALPHVFWS